MWNGTLFLGDYMVVYLGPAGPASWHAHHAVQITLAWDAPVTVEMEGRGVLRGRSALVPSSMRHRLETRAERVAVVFVDHVSAAGRALDERARAGVALALPLPPADARRAWPGL
jgi:hypothetical protein